MGRIKVAWRPVPCAQDFQDSVVRRLEPSEKIRPDDAFRLFDKDGVEGFVEPLKVANGDYLSESDVCALQESLDLYGACSLDELKGLSRKHAWKSAHDAGPNTSIRMGEMLDEIGADAELRECAMDDIRFRQAWENFCSCQL